MTNDTDVAPLSVVLTDRIGEIDEALALVHDGFLESGYIEPSPSGRRVMPHYLTPGIAFALANQRGRTIGVVTSVPDGPYGLPSEEVFHREFDEVRTMGGPVIEVGSLVVHRDHRAQTRSILLMLLMAILQRSVITTPDEVGTCTVLPEQGRFYSAALGMKVVGEVRDLYGAPAVLLASRMDDIARWVTSGTGILRRTAGGFFRDDRSGWATIHPELLGGAPLRVPREYLGEPAVSGVTGALAVA